MEDKKREEREGRHEGQGRKFGNNQNATALDFFERFIQRIVRKLILIFKKREYKFFGNAGTNKNFTWNWTKGSEGCTGRAK